MSDNDTQLNEVRQMTAEVLGAMRALAALPDAFKLHTERIDRARQ